jgi:hypothetical protein
LAASSQTGSYPMVTQTPNNQSEASLFPEEAESSRPEAISASAPIAREEARDAINDLFRRAMKHDGAHQWMKGLFTFIAGMRRYSIFNAKLIYVQRPGALAVGTPLYWANRDRSIRPGALPIVIFAPKGPFCLVYEYEDTEGAEPQRPLASFAATGSISSRDWDRLKAKVESDGRRPPTEPGIFRIVEEGLGHGRAGDVHHRRDAQDRFVIRINRNLDPPTKWATLVHELGHVYCGHCGRHDRGWWPDRCELPGVHPKMQYDIREFEAEAVAWIVASRAGIATKSADYLASRVAPLDNERVDLDAILKSANHIESLAPTTALKAFRADDPA